MAHATTFTDRFDAVRQRDQTLDDDVHSLLEQLIQIADDDPRHEQLRNQVVDRALPLADRLARRFRNRGEPPDDLTQVARLALVKAVDHCRPERGQGFARFAIPSILGELKRHFRDKGWLVRAPRRLQETRLAVKKACPSDWGASPRLAITRSTSTCP